MHIFWNNILKFPRFFISVLLGFLLTNFYTTIKLLKKTKNNTLIIFVISLLSIFLTQILKLMLAIN